MCADNNIKSLAGNEPDCNVDPACDGVETVPNQNHTTCGELVLFYTTVDIGQIRESG